MSVAFRQTVALGVVNVHECQALRRRRDAAQRAITGAHELASPVDRRAAATDLHENADEISHHVMEESIRPKIERQDTPFGSDTDR